MAGMNRRGTPDEGYRFHHPAVPRIDTGPRKDYNMKTN